MPVKGDHRKHVVGEGKGEGLEELKCIKESLIDNQVLHFTHLKCLASHKSKVPLSTKGLPHHLPCNVLINKGAFKYYISRFSEI